MLTDREPTARDDIETAAAHCGTAEHYVLLRVLWFQVLFALLDGTPPDSLLKSIDEAFHESGAHEEWTIAPVLDVVEPRLKPSEFDLLKALATALNTQEGVERLASFLEWRSSQEG
jgi:hypothetical protein